MKGWKVQKRWKDRNNGKDDRIESIEKMKGLKVKKRWKDRNDRKDESIEMIETQKYRNDRKD